MKAEKGSHNYNYVNQILYDKFGNRKYIAYGNGTATTYNYDHANLRMTHLQTVTAAGRLIQNNHYEYDAVGNILSLNNDAEIVEHETLYGGPTTNRYSYDNRYQLVSAEGTHQGYDKQHKYNLTMEYGATGKIQRKIQNNQWRKTDGDWNSDAETTVDYRYTYDGQKPHAVSSIIDNNTETLHTFTYDASGNNLLETNSKASSDRQMVWTEDNRLASIKARGNISHYLYDANGIRTLKMSSSSFNISVNGVEAGSSAVDGNFTIYANPYAVVRKNQYTKHYFLGTQRILTKIGNSEVEKTFFEGYAENIVPNVDYQGKQDDLENKFVLNNELLNVGWYRETRGRIPSQHIKHYLRSKEYGGQSGNNPWGEGNNTDDTDKTATYEEKQYFFHPDHLGSSNYLTDVLGEVYQHIEYLPWGEVFVEERNTQTSRNTFLYTGKELDEMTGLYYYEQRYYDPNKSTFLGVDQLTDKYPHISGFAYVANNPMIFIDPDGRDWVQEKETQKYVWMDGVKGKTDTPEDYRYIGADDNDILIDLNLRTEFSTKNETRTSFGLDGDEKIGVPIGTKSDIEGNLKIKANVGYQKTHINENNIKGKVFNGIILEVNFSQSAHSSSSDLAMNYRGFFQVEYGNNIYVSMLKKPSGSYIYETGSNPLNSKINIPVSEINNSKVFKNAFMSLGVTNSSLFFSPKPIKLSWELMRNTVITPKY